MLSFLSQPLFAEFDEFEKEAAIYWFANDWHGGQASSLYQALSESPYKPGPLENGPEHGEVDGVMYLYNELREEFNPTKD